MYSFFMIDVSLCTVFGGGSTLPHRCVHVHVSVFPHIFSVGRSCMRLSPGPRMHLQEGVKKPTEGHVHAPSTDRCHTYCFICNVPPFLIPGTYIICIYFLADMTFPSIPVMTMYAWGLILYHPFMHFLLIFPAVEVSLRLCYDSRVVSSGMLRECGVIRAL